MKQYWLFVLTALQDIVFCTIDSAFANNISLDVIVVLNTFSVVSYFCLRPMLLGYYAYQAMQSRPKNCLVCALISGVTMGALIVIASQILPLMFTLTDIQRESLSEIFVLFGICAPIQAVAHFLQAYCSYNNMPKLVFIVNLVTYIPMLIGDWVAVRLNAGAFGLHLATELCWLLCLIAFLLGSGILKVEDKIEGKVVLHCFNMGKDVCVSHLIVRGSTMFLTSMASTMGTVAYAVHSVALNITDMAESFRDAVRSCSYSELRDHRDDLLGQSIKVWKKLFLPSLLLPLGLEVILVFVMHGKVDISDTAIVTAIYSLSFLVYALYDIVAAAVQLSTVRQAAIPMSLLTMFWRVGVLILFIKIFGVEIPIFGTIFFLDYLSRMIFYIIMLYKEKKRLDSDKEVVLMDREG